MLFRAYEIFNLFLSSNEGSKLMIHLHTYLRYASNLLRYATRTSPNFSRYETENAPVCAQNLVVYTFGAFISTPIANGFETLYETRLHPILI